jgi:hypothetical protein
MWRDAPSVYGPSKTLYNRFIRWSRIGVFDRIFAALAGESAATDTVMVDRAHLKGHRTAASLLKKGAVPRRIGRTKGGLNSKLQAANVLIADKGIEARLISRGFGRPRNRALHSRPGEPQSPYPLRRRPLQTAQPHRADGRQAQGLATHRH